MNAYNRLLLPENLNYAWLKAKSLYRNADGYIDMGELAEFELDLEQRLLEIQRQFERGHYRLKKLRPLPRPKKLSNDSPINRQYFHVAVEDQVAWIALANALGPELDKKMPPWSYGNRLYRPAWYEKGENRESILEIGPYRHATGHLYRKFKHSWPLFRRHVALTARVMVSGGQLDPNEMDEADRLAAASAKSENLPYLKADFWPPRAGTESELYHASIDLKQFYPQLKLDAVVAGLAAADATEDLRIQNLLTDMLRFRLDTSGMPERTLAEVEPPFLQRSVRGIPTGLFVAGFLANAAMLPIDSVVDQELKELRSIAHFRFVDDHTIIAYDFDKLCDWINWYEELLHKHSIGAMINSEKYDPPSLSEWMSARRKHLASTTLLSSKATDRYDAKRGSAMRETRLDGKNPTKLMTKTLAQVSAIAATNIHILDDEDLEERLRMLEWLLLADIPEREIRPDTRAAFAAGQIASLASVLVQEADGLVNTARLIAQFKSRKPDPKRTTEEERESYNQELEKLLQKLEDCENTHSTDETSLLSRCFTLLLQSFREHPGKARLFYRIHEYCRVTGYAGLSAVAEWLEETRAAGKDVWADYYAGLSLQILARGILVAARLIEANIALRSDISAALRYLTDVGSLSTAAFLGPRDKEAWFHAIGRKEFGVALLAVAKTLDSRADTASLPARLTALANQCIALVPHAPADAWKAETGWTSGTWAHLVENALGRDEKPSAVWYGLAEHFTFTHRIDLQAARRYPEWFPDAGWNQLLRGADTLPESDSGWLRDVMGSDETRRASALASGKIAFTRAARSLEPPAKDWITLTEWSSAVTLLSPFDPRRSEWTALEITAQLVAPVIKFDGDETVLDRLHPNNVLLPRNWIDNDEKLTRVNWEDWRSFVKSLQSGHAKLRDSATSLLDYRYMPGSKAGRQLADWERRLIAVGRLLLGLLRNNHAAPRLWNMRGNEQIIRLPRARWFQALAISSPTLLLVESCLGARSAETRSIARTPDLFGWRDGEDANDAGFDPPLLVGANALLMAIRKAQQILQDNQLAVTMNQPRQLIPFRLSDFAAGANDEDAIEGEGDGDGE